MQINKRITQLKDDVEKFEDELRKRQEVISRTQAEMGQITEAILTRRGGIMELEKLEKECNESDPCEDRKLREK